MTHTMTLRARTTQGGTALVVGLVLLTVITLLAISGMNTSTLELQMAGNMQYARKSLEAAETGIEMMFRQLSYDSSLVTTLPATPITSSATETDFYYGTITYAGRTNCVEGCSLGEGKVGTGSHHFVIASTGKSSRNSFTDVNQGFFIPGP